MGLRKKSINLDKTDKVLLEQFTSGRIPNLGLCNFTNNLKFGNFFNVILDKKQL